MNILKFFAFFLAWLLCGVAVAQPMPYPLGVPRVIGVARAVDMTSTADVAIPINFTPGRLWTIGSTVAGISSSVGAIIGNCTASMVGGTAQGSLYLSPGKVGILQNAALAVQPAIAPAFVRLAAASAPNANVFYTQNVVYWTLTAASGTPALCDIYVFGVIFP
jgi:hypothetical protein